ncbi:multiple C2 and transmembrane domain-containing protein 2 isoform X2 [Nothobranchius furzeri]|uniref:Transcript variant X3 n=1 Tax=Nothobranchius furzeri TaxID=105023 RepID=A0A9D2YPP9_NOTFU|nr:multiple C2 and transmembrane domain-containing protein 2 isoform X2 [Nothobranchius furzeri]KAF7224495.1 transcript variant X3 [Nothobranchius furzeri]
MEVKKKAFFENLRIKTKFPPMKKRKKLLAKQPRNLANRRSVSVPDLTRLSSEADSTDGTLPPTPSAAIYFNTSSGMSDTDSIASGSTCDGRLFDDKLFDDVTIKVPQMNNLGARGNRLSAPEGFLNEDLNNVKSLGKKGNSTQEGLNVQADKKAKKNVPIFSFPEPEHEGDDRVSLSSYDTPTDRRRSESVAAFLLRAQSLGEDKRPQVEKRTLPEKGMAQTNNKSDSAEKTSMLDVSFDGSDATSHTSACDIVMDEHTNLEDELLEHDNTSLMTNLMKDYSIEEGEPDESIEENSAEVFEGDELEDNDELVENSDTSTGPSPDPLVPSPLQRFLLTINLREGKNLVVRDRRSGTSDPYVKFKLEGKQFYKSKVVPKNLNPKWNESFSHPLRERDQIVELRVYDKNLTSDDFMGSCTISLGHLELQKLHELELPLDDPKSKEQDMGVIVLSVRLLFRDATVKRPPRFRPKKNKNQNQSPATPRSADTQKNQLKNQTWSSVLHITLVEGQDLPQHGQGDVYVRFRLGDQKYKSKNLCIQANPQWREQFDFNQFEDNQEPLQVEVFSKRGRKGEESWGAFEVDVSRLPVNERQLCTNVLDPGKGKLVVLVTQTPCWGVSITDTENATLGNQDERDSVTDSFSLKNSHKCLREVGFLQVSVLKANDLPATDINGKSNPYCVVELGNCKLHTHTVFKTVNPEWNKTFTFPIKDIHDVVELTVLDENGDNFLGKVAIPLLTKEDLGRTASKGTITLVMEVIYNKVRAGLRTFKPKEAKLVEENLKFNKKILARNIYRVRKISTAILYTLQYIRSCFQWESTRRSLITFLIFLVTVWHWELFMLPLFLLLLLFWNYFQIPAKSNSTQDLVNMPMGDDEDDDEKEAGKKGLMDKIHMVQEVVLTVQNVLEEIADIGERIKNVFNWSVPFMSYLACLVLFAAATLLYFIPLRYIVLVWGINKFTKKLRNPYSVDNNEILNFLQRVPSDIQKVQYSALRAPTAQNQPRKRK